MMSIDTKRRLLVLGLLIGSGLGLGGCQDQDGGKHHFTSTFSISDDDQHGAGKDAGHGHIQSGVTMVDGRIVLHAEDQPDASIGKQGDFRIADRPVSLSAAQQALFQQYYAEAETIVHRAIDVAAAGADAGVGISAGILQNLLSGNTDDASMHATVHSHLQGLSRSVDTICEQLTTQKLTQDQIAVQLPAWRPYATISDAKIQECHQSAQHMLDTTAHKDGSSNR